MAILYLSGILLFKWLLEQGKTNNYKLLDLSFNRSQLLLSTAPWESNLL